MTVRPAVQADRSALAALAEHSGYPYPALDCPTLESFYVVVDNEGAVVMGCAAKRLVELYLYVDEKRHPFAKRNALTLFHEAMTIDLTSKGYESVEAFVPPSISERFGARLKRSFGWRKNWPSWTKTLGKAA